MDLNKPPFETEITESGWLLNDIVFTTRNLHKWVKDEKAPDIDLAFKFMNPKIRKDPLGCVLVIGYVIWNNGKSGSIETNDSLSFPRLSAVPSTSLSN